MHNYYDFGLPPSRADRFIRVNGLPAFESPSSASLLLITYFIESSSHLRQRLYFDSIISVLFQQRYVNSHGQRSSCCKCRSKSALICRGGHGWPGASSDRTVLSCRKFESPSKKNGTRQGTAFSLNWRARRDSNSRPLGS